MTSSQSDILDEVVRQIKEAIDDFNKAHPESRAFYPDMVEVISLNTKPSL